MRLHYLSRKEKLNLPGSSTELGLHETIADAVEQDLKNYANSVVSVQKKTSITTFALKL